jgi:hypothetical protein
MANENKRLIPMTITHTDDNNWRITVEGENSYYVKGDIEDIKKVCRRIKAKDGENNNKCRSAKVGTYLSMVSNSDNKEHKINVWKSRVPHTAEDFKKLMESRTTDEQIRLDGVSDNVEFYIGVYEENGKLSKVQLKDLYDNLNLLWVNKSYPYTFNLGLEVLNACGYKNNFDLMKENKEMKTITLTKNYLIEGNIVSKGTVVELKEEKIDFLPTDIWNKVQEIKDETERFEYVKKELGDEFTDEEIKDFLNKYENNLNESLKESNGFYYICYYGSSGDGYVGYDNRPTNNLDDAIQFDDKKEAELFKKDLQKEWKSKLYIAYYSE